MQEILNYIIRFYIAFVMHYLATQLEKYNALCASFIYGIIVKFSVNLVSSSMFTLFKKCMEKKRKMNEAK